MTPLAISVSAGLNAPQVTGGVVNQAPTATITGPADSSSHTETDTINFTGTGSDTEDGSLTGASLVWTSDLDGQFGTGTSVSTDALSVGNHTITLTATDSGGKTGTDQISIEVTAVSSLLGAADVAYWKVRDYDSATPGAGIPQGGALGAGAAQLGSTSGSDTNDPLFLNHDGTDYTYFPGTASNTVTVAGLSASTTYDYTVTYEDDTTATGSITTDGSGSGVFGGTQTNFSDKGVKSISVEPSGGGAEVALYDSSLPAAAYVGHTDTHGLTWTQQRSSGGLTTAVVMRAALMFDQVDDLLVISDHADLDFGAGQDYTIVAELEPAGLSANQYVIAKTNASATNVGWHLAIISPGVVRTKEITSGGGVNADSPSLGSVGDGPITIASRRDTASNELVAIAEGVAGTAATPNEGDTSNALDVSVGAVGTTSPYQGLFYGAAIKRGLWTAAETDTVGDELVSA